MFVMTLNAWSQCCGPCHLGKLLLSAAAANVVCQSSVSVQDDKEFSLASNRRLVRSDSVWLECSGDLQQRLA